MLIRLLRMYFPRNWELGSALSKLRNFGGGVFEPPQLPPPPSVRHWFGLKVPRLRPLVLLIRVILICSIDGVTLTEVNQSTVQVALWPSPLLHALAPGSNLALRSERLATDRLSRSCNSSKIYLKIEFLPNGKHIKYALQRANFKAV
jgi:hypothetical protein